MSAETRVIVLGLKERTNVKSKQGAPPTAIPDFRGQCLLADAARKGPEIIAVSHVIFEISACKQTEQFYKLWFELCMLKIIQTLSL